MTYPMEISESELRVMRDAVFGKAATQNNWDSCCVRWMDDWHWLYERFTDMGFKIEKPF